MGSSDGSQDRNRDNSDKETQSPMLKVFKEMMKREANLDPEKVSLIYPTKDEKKRKKHSHSKTKFSEERRFDPTTLDQAKSQIIYNMTPMKSATTDRPDRKYSLPNTQCYCSTSEKESKSGVSCAGDKEEAHSSFFSSLQRLISVEHSRVACFTVFALVSVAVACAVLFSSVPDLGRSYFGKAKAEQAVDKDQGKSAELEKIKSHLEQTRTDEYLAHPTNYYSNKWPSMQRSLTSNVEFSDTDETEYGARGMQRRDGGGEGGYQSRCPIKSSPLSYPSTLRKYMRSQRELTAKIHISHVGHFRIRAKPSGRCAGCALYQSGLSLFGTGVSRPVCVQMCLFRMEN
ncbi:hypothetical protein EVAR_89092_1 [Eumeta japonica]|uniref:Uncharacterized protein n=1 Tax=Eumeta variegata TaxID=151549 RepID=A0A4C1XFG7_EUMVA|nr:hypothetical protein EVAR_89092_1 [Eumeta japonica]